MEDTILSARADFNATRLSEALALEHGVDIDDHLTVLRVIRGPAICQLDEARYV